MRSVDYWYQRKDVHASMYFCHKNKIHKNEIKCDFIVNSKLINQKKKKRKKVSLNSSIFKAQIYEY